MQGSAEWLAARQSGPWASATPTQLAFHGVEQLRKFTEAQWEKATNFVDGTVIFNDLRLGKHRPPVLSSAAHCRSMFGTSPSLQMLAVPELVRWMICCLHVAAFSVLLTCLILYLFVRATRCSVLFFELRPFRQTYRFANIVCLSSFLTIEFY